MRRWLALFGAELAGSFALVFVGTAAIAVFMGDPSVLKMIEPHFPRLCLVLLCFGLVIAAVVHSPLGRISGAHINPAVSLAFALQGALPARSLPPYLLGQTGGALAGAALTALLLPAQSAASGYGATLPSAQHPLWLALGAEFAGTLLLMLLILACLEHAVWRGWIGIAAGSFVAVYGTAVAHLSGSSFNPARSLGPAVVAGEYSMLWLYLLCPVAGALFAAAIWRWAGLHRRRAFC